ncbi:hypothetical protein RI578_06770 [Streptomyces sp. BB1-1-1]|uniref:hypothetical protein n=1 Tax=Streptomyces sp. BB1-1-1 TaxID=3074430 RepID=UPI0028777941|nr:hypothetical protein [Streptomyces sp. BB1-1-1]WND34016.1 hypothetical protein RI578_06770 [Streptomyces sp. BB1-1-1]
MKTAIRNFNGHPQQLAVGRCPDCGKATYLSRRDAKRAARGMFPGVHHRPVQCGDRWHIQRVSGESG